MQLFNALTHQYLIHSIDTYNPLQCIDASQYCPILNNNNTTGTYQGTGSRNSCNTDIMRYTTLNVKRFTGLNVLFNIIKERHFYSQRIFTVLSKTVKT